jgi:hypothetical protein
VLRDSLRKRDRFWPLDLVADVNEAMIDAHLKLSRGLVRLALIVIKFFEGLEG